MLKNECTRNCWLAAAVAGLLVWLFNLFAGGFIAGLLLGLIAFFLMGNLLIWLVCNGGGGVTESAEVLGERATAHDIGDGGVLDRAEDAIVNAGNAFAAGTVSAVEKGRGALHDMRNEAREDREKMRNERYDDSDRGEDGDDLGDRIQERQETADAPVKEAMGALAARGKTAPDAPNEEDTQVSDDAVEIAQASSTPEVTPLPAPEEVAPAKVKAKVAKPASGADNLKEIKGIGPQLEKLLHDNDVTSFAQIAAWDDAAVDHFAEVIGRMGGRIRSDDWVGQAKLLAAGQETEFSRRVDKGEVY
ncbi:hypothetical protein [Paracoccus xiamenensis]|uniref:hypothetical protein n=1 Tax=Paracoccus xiamenensis TaxID=2714901 RepID=UPI00140BE223|nr:hypothetical protein [Paracoccus xiamenensis]NHF74160.1 hypothetical protein [Paracoccus xiamenensis]